MATFLQLDHVSVVRGERIVLHDINLLIESGQQIALLGPNGCGKSTLLKTISCELYPLASPGTRVSIFGRERWDLTELKKRLGVVQSEIPGKPMLKITGRDALLTGFFSSSTLWPNLTVTSEMEVRADEVLEEIDATRLRNVLFGEMSAGQQRRILIGRALVGSSGCLLLDEPSNALDLAAQRGLYELADPPRRAGNHDALHHASHCRHHSRDRSRHHDARRQDHSGWSREATCSRSRC